MNIPAKFGQKWPSDFGVEDCYVKGLQTTYNKDDGLKVMIVADMTIGSREIENHMPYTS